LSIIEKKKKYFRQIETQANQQAKKISALLLDERWKKDPEFMSEQKNTLAPLVFQFTGLAQQKNPPEAVVGLLKKMDYYMLNGSKT